MSTMFIFAGIICLLLVILYLIDYIPNTKQREKLKFLSAKYDEIILPAMICRLNCQNNLCPQKKEFIQQIIQNFNPKNIYKSIRIAGITAFTLNKSKIFMCLEDHQEDDLLLFVFLHELAHIGTKSIDHSEEFWKDFQFLINITCEANCQIHPRDQLFKYCHQSFKQGTTYCGKSVSVNPRFQNFE